MAVILHYVNRALDPVVLEDGVAWEFGGARWHRMIVSGTGTRYWVVDEPDMSGFCCDHCNPDVDMRPQAAVNDIPAQTSWLHNGDRVSFGEIRWRAEMRRGHLSRVRDLFRLGTTEQPMRFFALLSRFEESLDPQAIGGLLRFAHATEHHNHLSQSFLRMIPVIQKAKPESRTAGAALGIALARLEVIRPEIAKRLLEQTIDDSELDRWVHIAALSVLALDEDHRDRAKDLQAMVRSALEEGDAPAAVAQACDTLALVLEDEPLRSLGEAARAVISDASARKRRTMAVAVLASLAERDPECARAVLRAASDPHENVRIAAARALASFPTAHEKSANDALLALLVDANDEVHEEAFAALFGGAERRVPADALLAEVDRAGNDPARLARLTQALDRLA